MEAVKGSQLDHCGYPLSGLPREPPGVRAPLQLHHRRLGQHSPVHSSAVVGEPRRPDSHLPTPAPPPPPPRQRKPTGGRALKGVTTAVSPSVLALRSEQGRDSFPRVATQPEKGRTTSSSARTKPGEGGQQGALRTSTQHGTPPSTQQQLAPMFRWSGESRNEVGGQRR